MPATYTLTVGRTLVNVVMVALLRIGVAPAATYRLTTVGRRTGRPRTTPVTLVEEGSQRWLVAPYGPVSWVKNARAAGSVTLTRGRHAVTSRIEEVLDPLEAAPVLKWYAMRVPITRQYFDAPPDAPVATFSAEAGRHPVFRIIPSAVRRP